jgi:hypothetical protein
MRTEDVFRVLTEFPWIVFLVYWFIGAIKTPHSLAGIVCLPVQHLADRGGGIRVIR